MLSFLSGINCERK